MQAGGSMSDDRLTLFRPSGFTLTVKFSEGRWGLSASGGDNLTPDELQRISTFTEGRDGAEEFMDKLNARAAR